MPRKKLNLDTTTLDSAIKELKKVASYEGFAGTSRDVLSSVHTHEELDRAREAVFAERDRLMKESEAFKQRIQTNAEAQIIKQAEMRAGIDSKVKGISSNYERPIARARVPEMNEVTWVCLECGAMNVNYKMIKGRKKQRRFVKRYAEMMKNLDMELSIREARNIIKRGIPYCIRCSGRKGRDVYMVKRPLREVQTIKSKKHEKIVSTPPKVLTRKQKEANREKEEKRKKKPSKRKKKA